MRIKIQQRPRESAKKVRESEGRGGDGEGNCKPHDLSEMFLTSSP